MYFENLYIRVLGNLLVEKLSKFDQDGEESLLSEIGFFGQLLDSQIV